MPVPTFLRRKIDGTSMDLEGLDGFRKGVTVGRSSSSALERIPQ
jgi:hypothetical protein